MSSFKVDRRMFLAWSNLKISPTPEQLAEWQYRLDERLGILGYSAGEKVDPKDLALAILEADEVTQKLK